MFSGIIESQVEVIAFKKDIKIAKLKLNLNKKLSQNLVIGSSVAINGCCLSLVANKKSIAAFDIIPETLSKTNLAKLKEGDLVNIERALKIGDEIGGHLLSGHIFDTTAFLGVKTSKKFHRFELTSNIAPYIFKKGFIALNGISLTVCEITPQEFSVALIPHTLNKTNLSKLKPLDRVNLEVDSQTQVIVDNFIKQKTKN